MDLILIECKGGMKGVILQQIVKLQINWHNQKYQITNNKKYYKISKYKWNALLPTKQFQGLY